jgi:hypothetical protein
VGAAIFDVRMSGNFIWFATVFFVYFFGGLRCIGHVLLCLCRPFCICQRFVDSNLESYRSKQARHPSSEIGG